MNLIDVFNELRDEGIYMEWNGLEDEDTDKEWLSLIGAKSSVHTSISREEWDSYSTGAQIDILLFEANKLTKETK